MGGLRTLLVTANVGSVFENLELGLEAWLSEVTWRLEGVDFVALHFQETGGKDYQNGVTHTIHTFFRALLERMESLGFRRGVGLVDSRSDLDHQYTALSSLYFIHSRVEAELSLWDFQEQRFVPLPPTYQLNVGLESTLFHKEKFPQHFFPNFKWSRKGFLRTRWRASADQQPFDLVNIHLFHDSDNLSAAAAFPSQFARNRENTMVHTLDRLGDAYPLFIFGDFNFRLNLEGVVARLGGSGQCPTIQSKTFQLPPEGELERKFLQDYHWLKEFEFERKTTGLLEFPLTFPPTYPFAEEGEGAATKFMGTRCPAWCDRVLFNQKGRSLISQESHAEYNVIGPNAMMGDHKPVFLRVTLQPQKDASSNSS